MISTLCSGMLSNCIQTIKEINENTKQFYLVRPKKMPTSTRDISLINKEFPEKQNNYAQQNSLSNSLLHSRKNSLELFSLSVLASLVLFIQLESSQNFGCVIFICVCCWCNHQLPFWVNEFQGLSNHICRVDWLLFLLLTPTRISDNFLSVFIYVYGLFGIFIT